MSAGNSLKAEKLLFVLSFYRGDYPQAIALLDWIRELDDKLPNPCLIVTEADAVREQVYETYQLARHIFSSVKVIQCPHRLPNESWPYGANWQFETAASFIEQNIRKPFLWCEPDCVPLEKGWLGEIEAEYFEAAKPFMGCVIAPGRQDLPGLMISGTAVYPANAWSKIQPCLNGGGKAWDVAAAEVMTREGRHSKLFFMIWGNRHDGPPTFVPEKRIIDSPNTLTLDRIPGDARFFHRCKDNSLIWLLRSFRQKPETRVEVRETPDITVVITNFKRPDKVEAAFSSCLKAGVRNIVVSASGCDVVLDSVHRNFKQRHPGTVIHSIPDDRGCNEMWLRGVQAARTKWVHILHDDDELLPAFSVLYGMMEENVGFFHWDGAKHAYPPRLIASDTSPYRTFPKLQPGLYSTDLFWPHLLNPNAASISPVAGLFHREHLIEVLMECEEYMQGPDFKASPTMMVGNDLLIWLRAVEKYPRFHYLTNPCISYGHWQGSWSYADHIKGEKKLLRNYNATREYYLHGPDLRDSDPKLARVYGQFIPKDQDAARFRNPVALWDDQYRTGRWIHMPIPDSCLPRLFKDSTGRSLPYIRDMVEYCFANSSADVCVLMNMDILPSPSLTRLLCQALRTHDAAYSFRRDIDAFGVLDDRQIRLNTQVYSGVDLFAITRKWWKEHGHQYPDMIYATEAWDHVMQLLMRKTGAREFLYLIYHLKHVCEGIYNKGSAGQDHNKALAKPFLEMMGIMPYWVVHRNTNPR